MRQKMQKHDTYLTGKPENRIKLVEPCTLLIADVRTYQHVTQISVFCTVIIGPRHHLGYRAGMFFLRGVPGELVPCKIIFFDTIFVDERR